MNKVVIQNTQLSKKEKQLHMPTVILVCIFFLLVSIFINKSVKSILKMFKRTNIDDLVNELSEHQNNDIAKPAKTYNKLRSFLPSDIGNIKFEKDTEKKGRDLEKYVEDLFNSIPNCMAKNCTYMVQSGQVKTASFGAIDHGGDVYVQDLNTKIPVYDEVDRNKIVKYRPRIILIQCKAYKQPEMNVDPIREVLGGKGIFNADICVVATTTDFFTDPAIKEAKASNVILWNFKDLQNIINEYNKNPDIESINKFLNPDKNSAYINKHQARR